MSESVGIPAYGGRQTVGAISTTYPFQPGVDVTGVLATGSGLAAVESVQAGSFSVSVAAAGTSTAAVTFSPAFPSACDAVLLTLNGLGGAVVNGAPYAASVASGGFTASLDVTTAGTGSVSGSWVALGH